MLHNQFIPLGLLRAKPKLWGAEAQNTAGECVENLAWRWVVQRETFHVSTGKFFRLLGPVTSLCVPSPTQLVMPLVPTPVLCNSPRFPLLRQCGHSCHPHGLPFCSPGHCLLTRTPNKSSRKLVSTYIYICAYSIRILLFILTIPCYYKTNKKWHVMLGTVSFSIFSFLNNFMLVLLLLPLYR